MKRKLAIYFLTAAMILGGAGISAMAEDETGYELLYENTFDNGATGGTEAFAYAADDFALSVVTPGGWNDALFEGNKGVATNSGSWPNKQGVVFDFTKGGTKDGLSEGVYKVSFDFSPSATALAGNSGTAYIGVNMTDHWQGGRMMHTRKNNNEKIVFGYEGSISGWAPSAGAETAATETVVTGDDLLKVEIVMNFTKNTATYYINGNKLTGHTNLPDSVNNFIIVISGYWDYFDNLKLEKWDTMQMVPESKEFAPNFVKLTFSDGIKNAAAISEMITLKNVYTGESVGVASVSQENAKTLKIVPETTLIGGYEYELEIKQNIQGNEGGQWGETLRFNLGGEGTIKSLKTIDFMGELSNFEIENVAELDGFVFEFSDAVSAQAIQNMTISDAEQNTIAYTYTITGNTANVIFTNALRGEKVYTITIPNLTVAYNITLKTKAGGISFKPVKLYKADGVTEITALEQISVNDNVKFKIDIVNTSDTERSALLSALMYNGNKMNGICFKNMTLQGGGRDTLTADFKIKDKNNISFAGLLWRSGKVMPIVPGVNLALE